MKRRNLLVHGATLLPAVLAGCLNSTNSTGESTTQPTTATTTSEQPGSEDLLLRNSGSTTRRVSLTVSPESNENPSIIDSTYELPNQNSLEFSSVLEHGQRYHIKSTLADGTSDVKTLTVEGCSGDQYNSNGEKPLIVEISDDGVLIWFLGCDMAFSTTFPRGSADQYEVSETTNGTTATEPTTGTTTEQ